MNQSLRIFLISLSLLFASRSYAQVFSFASSCQPAIGDSVVSDAFHKQCISSWNNSKGNPSFIVSKEIPNAALLAHQEGIMLTKLFDHCAIYNIQLVVKTNMASASKLELVFKKQNESAFVLTLSLLSTSAHGWIQLFAHGIFLEHDFESLELVFKSENNSLLIDELEISSTCIPSLQIGQATGNVSSSEEITFKPITIKPNDTLRVSAGKSILLSGEVVLKEGSEVRLGIAPCTTTNEKCAVVIEPTPPKNFAVYNFLTPNGDGQNDTFYIENLEEFPNAELLILSKSGKIVFHSNAYKNDWDGGSESKGIYTYQLRLKEGEKPLKGELLLER